ncbi:MAG: FkbM family methyltransferase [Sulfurovum sp.]|nr:FkbM family methyltransferase [Sulfurovum sp.]
MLNKIVNKIKLRYYDRDSWNYFLILLKLKYKEHSAENKSFLFLKVLNLKIPRNRFIFLLKAYDHALKLVECTDAVFTIEENRVYISVAELKFEVQTEEELFILKEIFIDGVYNFHLVEAIDNYILIDIGMNVSYASCYFVKVKKIPHIISFEPFIPTYTQAKMNIHLNNLENRIDARNYGLGKSDNVLSVEYTPEFKGQMNMHGTEYIRSRIRESSREDITIKKAFEPLSIIEEAYPSKRFILKIDCEGAEYDLIEEIPHEMLRRCDVIMMEWHEQGSLLIESWLKRHRFILMSFEPLSKRAGMIYAIKSK